MDATETDIEETSRIFNKYLVYGLLGSHPGASLVLGYQGWEEQSVRCYRHENIGSHHIADITVYLGRTPKQELVLTLHRAIQ
jgi:hypothetical protein